MDNNSIEILGQKFTYPTTWQGAFSVLVIFSCIAYLGSTLSNEEIDSWGNLLNRSSEEAYNKSLATIEQQRRQIDALTQKVSELTHRANLSEAEKLSLANELESRRADTERAITSLSQVQQERVNTLAITKDSMPTAEQRAYFIEQQQTITQQLSDVKQQQETLKTLKAPVLEAR